MTRMTIAATNARIDALAGDVAEVASMLRALVDASAPAKATKDPKATAPEPVKVATRQCKGKTNAGARCKRLTAAKFCTSHASVDKAASAPKSAKAAKATKGSQTRETLTRAQWNRTLTAKARLAGGGAYRAVTSAWAEVQVLRTAGATPDEVLARFTK